MTPVICTVDVVLLTLCEGGLHVALLKRDRPPFEGTLALPGGYVHAEEDADTQDAAARMLLEKTGIVSPYLEQLGTFSGQARDPRGWSISVAYYALVPPALISSAGHPGVVTKPIAELKGLPFDHRQIIDAAERRVRDKSSYSSLPIYLLDDTFTIPQLQHVYEQLLGGPINRVTFRRKLDELDLLEAVEGMLEAGKANRPAQVYRVKAAKRRHLVVTGRSLAIGN